MNPELIYLIVGLALGLAIVLFMKSSASKVEDQNLVKKQLEESLIRIRILETQLDKAEKDLNRSEEVITDLNIQIRNQLAFGSNLQGSFDAQQQQLIAKNAELARLNEEKESQRQTEVLLQRQISEMRSESQYLLERLQNQKRDLEEMKNQSQLEFQNLANKILEEKSQKFTQSNRENIETLLKPLGENLDQFRKKVEETYDKESKQRFSLEDRVKELIELNNRLSQEASNLTRALKGDSKKMGNWGEIILESILEQSGLQKNREYVVQESLKDENGKELRPDVLVFLPEERTIILDSKVSLVAYDRFVAAESREEQQEAMRQHIQSMKAHIDELSRKKYEKLVKSLDFVMMFVPIEPAYLVAIQEDRELWSYAYQKRVLLISPTNLVAALKLVADLWKRESQSRNAIEIAKQGERLLDKFLGFAETLEEIGKHIHRSSEAYSDAIKKLRDGKGNLVDQAMKLKKLGVGSRKSLPNSLLSFDVEEEESTESDQTGDIQKEDGTAF